MSRWQRFKKWLRDEMRDPVDAAFDKERAFISANYNAARAHLNKLGWTVISEDTRIAFFSLRIQKGEHIHSVGIREALAMK